MFSKFPHNPAGGRCQPHVGGSFAQQRQQRGVPVPRGRPPAGRPRRQARARRELNRRGGPLTSMSGGAMLPLVVLLVLVMVVLGL